VAPILNVHVPGQIIRTTAEHPFWVLGRGWIPAAMLDVGDQLTTRDGRLVPVEGVADSGAVETVYNWQIMDYHTYFVSATEVGGSLWAHNVRRCGPEEDLRGLSVVSGRRAHRSFEQPTRYYLSLPTQIHHPFFRMFLGALERLGYRTRGSAGRRMRQAIEVLEIPEHRALHRAWDAYVRSNGLPPELLSSGLRQRGNSRRLAAVLERGDRIDVRGLFDHLHTFYSQQNTSTGLNALASVRGTRGQLRVPQTAQGELPF
jgi:hypothetical protein